MRSAARGCPWPPAAAPVVFEAGKIYISSNAGPGPLAGPQCSRQFFAVSYQNDANTGTGPALIANNRGFKHIVGIAPHYPTGREAIAGISGTSNGKPTRANYPQHGQPDGLGRPAQWRRTAQHGDCPV